MLGCGREGEEEGRIEGREKEETGEGGEMFEVETWWNDGFLFDGDVANHDAGSAQLVNTFVTFIPLLFLFKLRYLVGNSIFSSSLSSSSSFCINGDGDSDDLEEKKQREVGEEEERGGGGSVGIG